MMLHMHEPTAKEFWSPPIRIACGLLSAGLCFFAGGYIFCLMRFGAPEFSSNVVLRFFQVTLPLYSGGMLCFVSYRLARYPIVAFLGNDAVVLLYWTYQVRHISCGDIVKTDFRKRFGPKLWLSNGRSVTLFLGWLTREDQNQVKDELLKRFGT